MVYNVRDGLLLNRVQEINPMNAIEAGTYDFKYVETGRGRFLLDRDGMVKISDRHDFYQGAIQGSTITLYASLETMADRPLRVVRTFDVLQADLEKALDTPSSRAA